MDIYPVQHSEHNDFRRQDAIHLRRFSQWVLMVQPRISRAAVRISAIRSGTSGQPARRNRRRVVIVIRFLGKHR